jgi:hypothetical protein
LARTECHFIGNCRTPMLVLPDDTPSHLLPTSIDVASLAPNAEITVFPWREPPKLKARTVNRLRTFLKSHVPMRSAVEVRLGRDPRATSLAFVPSAGEISN